MSGKIIKTTDKSMFIHHQLLLYLGIMGLVRDKLHKIIFKIIGSVTRIDLGNHRRETGARSGEIDHSQNLCFSRSSAE